MPRSAPIRLIAIASLACLVSMPSTAAPAGTHWITLGTMGGPIPSKDRAQPANLLVVNGRDYLIDAGNGVAAQLTKAGVDCRDISTIFISHNHRYSRPSVLP
jgi:glyoxylase-like metal-dependent hydrolase (beta-lactamase superfamily II)